MAKNKILPSVEDTFHHNDVRQHFKEVFPATKVEAGANVNISQKAAA